MTDFPRRFNNMCVSQSIYLHITNSVTTCNIVFQPYRISVRTITFKGNESSDRSAVVTIGKGQLVYDLDMNDQVVICLVDCLFHPLINHSLDPLFVRFKYKAVPFFLQMLILHQVTCTSHVYPLRQPRSSGHQVTARSVTRFLSMGSFTRQCAQERSSTQSLTLSQTICIRCMFARRTPSGWWNTTMKWTLKWIF